MGGKGRAPAQQTSTPAMDPPVQVGPHHQGQQLLGNAEMQQRMTSGKTDAECDQARLPTPIPANGDLGYYNARHDDFSNRYRFCGMSPPVYYLGYGGKYVRRFTFETNDRLTPKGQQWLARARVLLQEASRA